MQHSIALEMLACCCQAVLTALAVCVQLLEKVAAGHQMSILAAAPSKVAWWPETASSLQPDAKGLAAAHLQAVGPCLG